MFWFLKSLNIGYVVSVNVILGLLFAKWLDQMFGNFNGQKEKKKYFTRSLFEMIFMLWVSGIVIYIFYAFLLKYIDRPIKFDSGKFETTVIFTFVLFYFQKTLKHKMQYIHDKMI